MSRRKQSNPKPLKRPSDEDSEDGEGGEITKSDITGQVELPPDILELQSCNEDGREVAVCGAIRLPQGSSLGPFVGEPVEEAEGEEDSDRTVIEFTDNRGKPVMLRMGDNGRWLSLLKKKDENTANCVVYYDGGKVWCEIRREVLIHSELTAVFTVENPGSSPARPDTPICVTDPPSPNSPPGVSTDPVTPLSSPQKSPVPQQEQPPAIHPLIYPCPFCAVRFSSPRTLDAHIQFYCSKKPPDLLMSPDGQLQSSLFSPTGYREGSHSVKGPSRQPAFEKSGMSEDERSLDSGPSGRSSPLSSERDQPERPSGKDLLKCQSCPYSCWSVSSLTRHRNKIHGVQSQKNNEEQFARLSPGDMFCYDCNIQFSSMSTFRGHKDYYCPKRLQDPESALSPNQRSARVKHSPQPSPENTMLTSPNFRSKGLSPKENQLYQGMGGIVVPTQFLSPSIPISMGNQPTVLLAAPILASGGLTNITMPAIIMQPVVNNREPSPCKNQKAIQRSEKSPVREKSPEVVEEAPKDGSEDLPLDLSTKKTASFSEVKDESSRENKRTEGTDGEDSATDLSISSRRSESESKARIRHNSRMSSGGVSSSVDRPGSASSKSGSRGNSESAHAPSPHLEVTDGKLLSASNHYLLYDQMGSPYVQGQLIPNPACLYGKMQNELIHGDARLTPTSPHVSKCLECNIVFFKHENFLIHKKHYCASRKRGGDTRSEDSNILPGHGINIQGYNPISQQDARKKGLDYRSGVKTKVSDLYDAKSLTESRSSLTINPQNSGGIHPLYYCNACCIKFSSADTLQAHKEFYCSQVKVKGSRDNSPRSSDLEGDTSPREIAETKSSLFPCSDCSNSYPSARLLRLHFCNTHAAKASLLRCLYCDFVAQTENKYVDHMKAHAPSKVYRCALCGYRGNTVRGMRMHGKMHVDQGSEFTDEHMVEFEEPPQIPATLVSGNGVGPVDVEAELIRMKNEPYKRRRSRKSYEKTGFAHSPAKHGRHVCPVCYDIFPDSGSLADHVRVHVSVDNKTTVMDQAMTRQENCKVKRETPYSDTEGVVVKSEMLEDQSSSRQLSPRQTSDDAHKESSSNPPRSSSSRSSPVSPTTPETKTNKSREEVPVENGFGEHPEKENVPLSMSRCVTTHSRQAPDHFQDTTLTQEADKLGPKYCKSCDINFTFLSSFLAHKRYYCSGVCPRERDSQTDSLSNTSLMRQQH